MKKTFFIIISFLFLTGCAQNIALLGPVFSIAKGGGIQQALVSESISRGIKNETGKDVSEHVMQFLDKDIKSQKCKNTNGGDKRKELFFDTLEDIDCKKFNK